MSRPKRYRVCAHLGCTRLVTKDDPCPEHTRPANASWTKDRDHKAQRYFRHNVLTRDGHRCTRCGATDDLVAHHIKPGYHADAGTTLCAACHRAIDTHAR